MLIIDHQKMRQLASMPPRPATATDLCRGGRAFFVGGDLPIQETLETMFESQCEASTDMFVVTFGGDETLRHGLEMVRSLKKNFNMRLMVRLHHRVPDPVYAQMYATGADLVEITVMSPEDGDEATYDAALAAFPRWAVASSLFIDGAERDQQVRVIDHLVRTGVVPLPRLCAGGAAGEKENCAVMDHLSRSWRHHKVPIKPFMPLIDVYSPLVQSQKPGPLRSLFERFQERRHLATSDLLRHLRVSAPTDSLDSAGL